MICSYNSSISPNISQQSTSLTITDTQNDTALHPNMTLVDWLRDLQVDDTSIDRVNSLSMSEREGIEQKLVTYSLSYIYLRTRFFNVFSSYMRNIHWRIFYIMLHEMIFAG